MTLLAGIGIGFILATLLFLFAFVIPMTESIKRLRYDGFRPEAPMPQRPKTIPPDRTIKFPNEALS